ncbi:Uncharacterized protein OS=Sorangium cellulosum (strain So ce56) GN=sce5710 PE=4 SV=1 [Gemmata massiliana]|uniref:Uncharacterized protein n=1 Tax=Gemmata massiliana TaxID=1210884 RepID=A0A6P2CYI3_9BACT|nr:hypothetical protein [Gemmata massiliana]VTR93446.1 Uncharacterized protein OS=Sorangium cellulosum (strain So ce56) GN=sce5710 PE=4 SV=1 [Gemmata massiliana]
MTEAEWLACANLKPMLHLLKGKASGRKLRLFSVACVRRVEKLLLGTISRTAVETAESHADGLLQATETELASDDPWLENRLYALENECIAHANGISNAEKWSGWNLSERAAYSATVAAAECVNHYFLASEWADQADWIAEASSDAVAFSSGGTWLTAMGMTSTAAHTIERSAQIRLLHEVFGNPFRLISVDLTWLTSTVRALAEGIYQDRAFDRMPILADALQDAECDNEDILAHCRGSAPHVRGCWVVDLLTGRK